MILNAKIPFNIRRAAEVLKNGGIVAFPTETVYGLGADAFNTKAVCRIFEIKKRPSFDPLIVHVANPRQAFGLWIEVPDVAVRLANKFWPGPLTLVLPKKSNVPDIVTAGLPTVAVRVPQNPLALSFIRSCGRPVAAPSANLFGRVSATTAQAVWDDLGKKVDLILDGGTTTIGIESTVIKIEKNRAILLRPGGISVEEIKKIIPVRSGRSPLGQYESPGLLKNHYAPRTPLVLAEKSSALFFEKWTMQKKKSSRVGLLAFSDGDLVRAKRCAALSLFSCIEVLSPQADLQEAASNLFHAVRKLDKMRLDLIVAMPVPKMGIGLAIMDRLQKASGGKAL